MASDKESAVYVTLRKFAEAYAKRDVSGVLDTFVPNDPDIVCIGTGAYQVCVGSGEIRAEFAKEFGKSDLLRVFPNWVKVTCRDTIAWVTTSYTADQVGLGKGREISGCFTGILEWRETKWLFMHVHFSHQPFE